MADLDSLAAIFKAYDVRGTVPEQLDADLAERIGAAFARFVEDAEDADRVLVARDMRPSGVELAAAFAEGVQRQGLDVVDLGLAPPTWCTSPRAPRRPRRHVHRLPQPGPVQRHQDVPVRAPGPSARTPGWPTSSALAHDGVPTPPGSPGRLEPADLLGDFVDHVRSFVDVGALRPAEGRGRHGQRHGRPRGAAGVRRAAVRPRGHVRRARRHVPQPPGRPHPAREPARPAGPGARDGRRHRPRLRRRRRPGLPGRRPGRAAVGLDHHRHRGQGHAREAPGRDHPLQPDLLQGRARDHRRERRHAGAHPGGPLVHQGGHGRDRRRLRRRALGALLLPRQLPGRLGQHRRPGRPRADLPGRRAAVGAAQAVRPLRGVGRDQHDRRRPRGRHRAGGGGLRRRRRRTASTGSPSTSATGGSTCARPTPSRCCGSTSRLPPARRATPTWPRCGP